MGMKIKNRFKRPRLKLSSRYLRFGTISHRKYEFDFQLIYTIFDLLLDTKNIILKNIY